MNYIGRKECVTKHTEILEYYWWYFCLHHLYTVIIINYKLIIIMERVKCRHLCPGNMTYLQPLARLWHQPSGQTSAPIQHYLSCLPPKYRHSASRKILVVSLDKILLQIHSILLLCQAKAIRARGLLQLP